LTPTVFVLNGPNLNLLGTREPEIYGSDTLDDIGRMLDTKAQELNVAIDMRQTNHEGVLVDWLHEAREVGAKAVLLNAGAYTHTSIALMDAISSVELPAIELHLSNVHAREEFRHVSYIARVAVGVICGFGPAGYELAIDAMARHLEARK